MSTTTSVPEHAAMTLSAGRAHRNSGLVAGAGHWVQYESAECINANLFEWLVAAAGDEFRAIPRPVVIADEALRRRSRPRI
ncbi:hypothetical protein [Ottowia sp.]|uniref:hypothetical protein n=1 Tax=Ottowia sp. TaxID=1898956 RepID=UPI0025D7B23B|nr:hypothetical protein [Ottowia sp.]MBK6616760.1 hypothetical protein [Ottowia sp.]